MITFAPLPPGATLEEVILRLQDAMRAIETLTASTAEPTSLEDLIVEISAADNLDWQRQIAELKQEVADIKLAMGSRG